MPKRLNPGSLLQISQFGMKVKKCTNTYKKSHKLLNTTVSVELKE